MFEFLKNMWILRNIDKDYLDNMVVKSRITESQKDEIIELRQIGD